MNANFLGQLSPQDMQALEQLRRSLMPMIGALDHLQADIVSDINQGKPTGWPQIRRTITAINAHLTSINGYLNGSYKRTAEEVRNSEGNVILDDEKNPKMIYRHYENPASKEKVGAMHVFPVAPFPMMNEKLAAMALTLLDKRLGPTEEKWVEERLRKAAEFAYVPGEWGIEAKKTEVKEEAEEDSDEDDMKGWDEGLPTKRVKGTLNEDELMDLWAVGYRAAFDRQYQRDKRFGQSDGEEGKEEDEDEDEEMEDVEVEGLAGSKGEGAQDEDDEEDEEDEEEAKAPPAPPVQLIKRGVHTVHKPVPGAPIMPLEIIHRFMVTGEVQGAPGQWR